MTTAHRPTWKPAFGLSDDVNKGYIPTRSYSSRDLPSYLALKERQWGQGSVEELKEKDFKAELLKSQAEARNIKNQGLQVLNTKSIQDSIDHKRLNQIDYIQYEPSLKKKIKRPDEEEKEIIGLGVNPFPEDEDSQSFIKQDNNEKKKKNRIDFQDDESSDDQQLIKEYEKIKQQRQKQEIYKRQEKHKNSIVNRQSQLLKGNPLIDSTYSLSKRWYEDTVFRNQAKKAVQKKTYINDYVRSDFHRKFMNKYVMR